MKGIIKKTSLILLAAFVILSLIVGVYGIFSLTNTPPEEDNSINTRLSVESGEAPLSVTVPVREDMLGWISPTTQAPTLSSLSFGTESAKRYT